MKFTGSLALALLAIAALMNSVAAISGLNMSMVGNSYGDSSFVATFVDRSGVDEFNQVLNFDAVLSGAVGEYTDMKCITELDSESRRLAAGRILATPVTEYPHKIAGYVSFQAAIRLRAGDVLGKFKLICTFVPAKVPEGGLRTAVYASVNQDESFVTTIATIRPFTGFSEKFGAYISPVPSPHAPTSFKITKPYSTIIGTHLRIKNPAAATATSASAVTFKSSFESSGCDGYWDGALYPNSVTATVARDGSYLDLSFGSAINVSSEIVVLCYSVGGQKTFPLMPTVLEAIYTVSSYSTRHNFAAAHDQISFSDFLAQTSDISPEQPLF